jgi:hypothetical protein
MNKRKYVKIKNLIQAIKFTSAAKNVKGTVTVQHGRYLINAASIVGITSTDMSERVIVEYPPQATDFEKFIEENYEYKNMEG